MQRECYHLTLRNKTKVVVEMRRSWTVEIFLNWMLVYLARVRLISGLVCEALWWSEGWCPSCVSQKGIVTVKLVADPQVSYLDHSSLGA